MEYPIEGMTGGQRARLVSTLPDNRREEKATSILLAALMVVPDYARSILNDASAQMGKTSKLECYVEVSFSKISACRPDGLIIVRTGSRMWSALVESKVKTALLEQKQVEEYLDLAKAVGVNALITISNEFVIIPTHHPLAVPKIKTRNVELFHFSWLSLISKSNLLSENRKVIDPEQSFILGELINFFEHPKSGVVAPLAMSEGWRDVVDEIQNRAELRPSQKTVVGAITSWLQLLRYLALQLSLRINSPVQISVSRAQVNDPHMHFNENVASFVTKNILVAEFDVDDAAAKIRFTADFTRRTINFSLKIDSPKDRSRSTAAINWLTRQLTHLSKSEVFIRGYWGRRMTTQKLSDVLSDPTHLVPKEVTDIPRYLELVQVVDLGAKFKSRKAFAGASRLALMSFYEDVVQHVNKWVPKPPKLQRVAEEINAEPHSASVMKALPEKNPEPVREIDRSENRIGNLTNPTPDSSSSN